MIRVQDQQDFEGPLEDRIGLMLASDAERHVDEVADVVQVVVGEDEREAARVAEDEGCDGRHLGHQPGTLEVAVGRIVDVLGVRVEGRQGTYRAQEHPHRMGVVQESLEELEHPGVDVGVVLNVVGPHVELVFGGELPHLHEIGDLEKRTGIGQLLDGVAPIPQDAAFPVDEGDGAATRRGVGIRRVVGHEPEVVVDDLDLAEVHRPDGAVGNGKLVLLAGAVVGDGQSVVGHERILARMVE